MGRIHGKDSHAALPLCRHEAIVHTDTQAGFDQIAKLKAAVDLIPVVTAHLPGIDGSTIRLLPADARVARPSRTKVA